MGVGIILMLRPEAGEANLRGGGRGTLEILFNQRTTGPRGFEDESN